MTSRILSTIGLASAIFFLSEAGPAEAGHGQLSGTEISAMLPTATVHGSGRRGSKYTIRYRDDGTMSLNSTTGFSDTGRWTVEADSYCAQWKKIRDSEKACWLIIHEDGEHYQFEGLDGADDHDIRITQ